jgi:diguanylate cyclase (GGDEF)-like protein
MEGSVQLQLHSELYTEGGVSRPQHFEDCLGREIARARRYGNQVSLLLVGFDDQAALRRSAGAERVREICDAVGELVCRRTRTTDVVGHHLEDEVAVLLPETAGASALLLADRVRRAIERRPIKGERVHVSIGVSSYRPDAAYGPDALVFEAESALEAARRDGGGRVHLFQA